MGVTLLRRATARRGEPEGRVRRSSLLDASMPASACAARWNRRRSKEERWEMIRLASWAWKAVPDPV